MLISAGGRFSGTDGASMYATRIGEHSESDKVEAELVARLAIALAMDYPPTNDRPLGLFERAKMAGIGREAEDYTSVLSPCEQACMPAATVMLDVYAKGYPA